jgi:hypothetical protein
MGTGLRAVPAAVTTHSAAPRLPKPVFLPLRRIHGLPITLKESRREAAASGWGTRADATPYFL